MNKVMMGVIVLLVAAVAFLFFKVYSGSEPAVSEATEKESELPRGKPEAVKLVTTTPTGKIAYVNIDRLNEESLEIGDLVTESKRRKNSIEASVEKLSTQYQQKVEEFQNSQKAGIAPESELRAKAREIEAIEKEAQEKQMQMDNLSMDINDKNMAFQRNVKDFLVKWNAGRYDYIFSYSDAVPSMLLGNATFDITSEVITELNKEYSQRKIKNK
jgi:Skp family chaperone for outer membrane proteins